MQYFTPGYYFSGGGESGDSDSCLPCDEYQGLPHTVQFPASACGTQVSFFLYLHSLWGSCNILKQLSTVGSLLSLIFSLSFLLSLSLLIFLSCLPFFYLIFSYCFPQFYFFIAATGLHSCFFPFFTIKLNKMVKLDLLLNLICTSNLLTNATILSGFMMIVFFLE